jgi:hypothetical protein
MLVNVVVTICIYCAICIMLCIGYVYVYCMLCYELLLYMYLVFNKYVKRCTSIDMDYLDPYKNK